MKEETEVKPKKETSSQQQKKFKERIKNGEPFIPLNRYGTPSEGEQKWNAKSNFIRSIVGPCYDLQDHRIEVGHKIVAAFYDKLGFDPSDKKSKKGATIDAIQALTVDEEIAEQEEIDEKKFKFIEFLKSEYKKITDAVAIGDGVGETSENQTKSVAKKAKIKKTLKSLEVRKSTIITEDAEKILIKYYIQLEKSENEMFKLLKESLHIFGGVSDWLLEQFGVSERLAGFILAYTDPYRAPNPSCFHAYYGLQVELTGKATSMSSKIIKEYIDKDGKIKFKESIKFQKYLKAKFLTCVGLNFLKKKCRWRKRYDEARFRYENRGDLDPVKDKGHIHKMALRIIAKEFLTELWLVMREDQGLKLTVPYHVAKLGMRDHTKDAA